MIQKYGLYTVWVAACLATLVSLYFNFSSPLDWCQRICLFPFVFIAGLAAWRGFLGIASYLLPQTFFGLCFAFYQFLIAKHPSLALSFFTEPARDPRIPLFSSLLFLFLLIFLTLLSKRQARRMVL